MKIFHYDPTELKFKKVPYTLLLIVLAAVLMFTTLISYGMSRTIYETVVITQETGMLVLREQNKFSEEAFDVYINSLNMKFPEIVKAQAILESSNFSSEIFKANNNMFGMKAKEQYYEYLGNNYAEDPNYVSKLKSIVAKNKID